MPRFFFDTTCRDGPTETDDEGVDLPNVSTARAEAARAAAEMVKDRVAGDDIGLTIIARDETGRALFQVAALVRVEPLPHSN